MRSNLEADDHNYAEVEEGSEVWIWAYINAFEYLLDNPTHISANQKKKGKSVGNDF